MSKPITQQVNIVGKYLYKNLSGAESYKVSTNMNDVYFWFLYQIPEEIQTLTGIEDDVHEILIDLNITTYADKLRVNIIEMEPEERTLGHQTFYASDLENLVDVKGQILKYIEKRLNKFYSQYEYAY